MRVSKTFLIVVHVMFLSMIFIVGINNNYLNKLLCLSCYENSMAWVTLFFGAATFSLMRLCYGSILNKYIVLYLSLSILAIIFAPQYDDYFALNKAHSILAIYILLLAGVAFNLLIKKIK